METGKISSAIECPTGELSLRIYFSEDTIDEKNYI